MTSAIRVPTAAVGEEVLSQLEGLEARIEAMDHATRGLWDRVWAAYRDDHPDMGPSEPVAAFVDAVEAQPHPTSAQIETFDHLNDQRAYLHDSYTVPWNFSLMDALESSAPAATLTDQQRLLLDHLIGHVGGGRSIPDPDDGTERCYLSISDHHLPLTLAEAVSMAEGVVPELDGDRLGLLTRLLDDPSLSAPDALAICRATFSDVV
jgi:hypothetical protein